MKKITHTLRQFKKQTLSPEERTRMLSRIHEYQAYTPLRSERMAAHTRLPHVKPLTGFPLFLNLKPMPLFIGLLIAASVSGGTAFAAEGALPGDILYPIKTSINENVRGTLAVDAEAKAEVDAWRAERRLDEAERLAYRTELSEETKVRLEGNFTAHAERVEARIKAIAETDPALAAELATRFEASLEAHEAVLAGIDAKTTAEIGTRVGTSIRALATLRANATEHLFALGDARAAASREASTMMMESDVARNVAPSASAQSENQDIAAKRMYGAAEASLARANEIYARAQTKLDAGIKTRVEAVLKESEVSFEEGARLYADGEFSNAFFTFQEVVRAMNHLAVFLQTGASSEINGNVRILPMPALPIHIDVDVQGDAGTEGNSGASPSTEADAESEDASIRLETKTRIEVGI